jgi:hypothetical protein
MCDDVYCRQGEENLNLAPPGALGRLRGRVRIIIKLALYWNTDNKILVLNGASPLNVKEIDP